MYITDNTYTKEEVILLMIDMFSFGLQLRSFHLQVSLNALFMVVKAVKMEADILKCFNFELGSPTIKTFLR